jgi:hypothetical protein
MLFAFLGIVGAWAHWQRDRKSFTYFAVLFGTLSFGLVFYLNFKYGFTLPTSLMRQDLLQMAQGQGRDLTEVRERDYFFIVSFSLWGLWAGVGLAALWQQITESLAARGKDKAPILASPVLLLALLPLILNWTWASRKNDYTARDWSYNLLMSIEPYGIVFTNGDNDTFPLWYLQEVEGIRRDVTVMVMSYLNTPWYVKQIRELTRPCQAGEDPLADPTRIICQRPYTPPEGVEDIYAAMLQPTDSPGVPVTPPAPGQRAPTTSIVPLTDAEIDTIANTPPYYLSEERIFSAAGLRTTLPVNDVIIPADMFMAAIIQTALGDRPVYYAMTTASYDELRLRPHLIRQGVAYKLSPQPVQADSVNGIFQPADPRVAATIGANIDVPRTEKLVTDVYLHRGGFPSTWGHWVDSATEGIPFYYAFTHLALHYAYQTMGNEQGALKHEQRYQEFMRLGNVREDAANR